MHLPRSRRDQQRCVDPGQEWTSKIDFDNLQHPGVAIQAYDDLCGEAPHSHHFAEVYFKSLHFAHGHTKMVSDASGSGKNLVLCADLEHTKTCVSFN
jgi:hypothetical protein